MVHTRHPFLSHVPVGRRWDSLVESPAWGVPRAVFSSETGWGRTSLRAPAELCAEVLSWGLCSSGSLLLQGRRSVCSASSTCPSEPLLNGSPGADKVSPAQDMPFRFTWDELTLEMNYTCKVPSFCHAMLPNLGSDILSSSGSRLRKEGHIGETPMGWGVALGGG